MSRDIKTPDEKPKQSFEEGRRRFQTHREWLKTLPKDAKRAYAEITLRELEAFAETF